MTTNTSEWKMMSMDAEAEMEGLFGGEDQGQDDAVATQSLTQEG